MKIEFLTRAKKKRYGLMKMPYLLIRIGQKIFGYSGGLSREEIMTLNKHVKIERIGLCVKFRL